MKPPPAPQSSANVVPCDETNGSVQPIRALYASIWASGMLDTVAQLTPLSRSAGQVGDVVGEVGAARAELVGPVVHELVDDQLALPGEQVEQGHRAGRRVEGVLAGVEPDHREPAAARGQHVQGAGRILLGREQLIAILLPLPG